MRNKIKWWLIRLANKIGTEQVCDFGEEIKSLQVWGTDLVVVTRNSLYVSESVADGKWRKVKPSTPKSGGESEGKDE